MAAFKGWKAEAVEFFEGLEADNSKGYWQEHRRTYDTLVLAPMQALLADLAGEFGDGHVMRPYRDIRFSADKSPYKTNIAAEVEDVGYVSFSAKGIGVGSGYWMMSADQLQRYRTAVVDKRAGGRLDDVLTELRGKGHGITAHETLKTAPRGYPKDHDRIDLLRMKGLAAWHEWPVAAWMGTAKAGERIAAFFRDAGVLRDWLDTHVGPSDLPPDGRG
ncbi:MAG TPA: DUF2461 domain-containing protein [Acidimicrobiales bacterium]|nr:DUF2461 domain-containing protein [Acidimicrobiales bacterium]